MFYRLLHVPFIIVVFVFSLSTCIHLFSDFGQPGIIIDFIGSQYPPSIIRLCLLDVFILLFQLLRLQIAHQLSVHTVSGAMLQISQALADTNQQSHQTIRSASTSSSFSATEERSPANSSGQVDNGTQTANTDSNYPFYNNDIVMGLSCSQVSQLFNSRRQHHRQASEDNTMELPT